MRALGINWDLFLVVLIVIGLVSDEFDDWVYYSHEVSLEDFIGKELFHNTAKMYVLYDISYVIFHLYYISKINKRKVSNYSWHGIYSSIANYDTKK